ncbi:hypothetical protein AAGW04_11815 [Pectobacterium aroidearum]|uniref:hypothetical protein n=1 Tax=Pectobacterium aroidearum TaxID=1201031 RepID=UPI0031592438
MKKKKIADLLAFKTNLFEVFIIAILISLGVNILSSGIFGKFNFSFTQSITIGLMFIFFGVLFFLRNASPINSGKYIYKGVVCIEKGTHDLVSIEGYDFTEKISQYVKALCAENKAIHKIWSDEPIGSGLSIEGNRSVRKEIKANDFLIEAIEYYVLSMLSLHLSSHFNNNKSVSNDYLVKLERRNIPDILLGNRFIDTFSRPMEEREQFLDRGFSSLHGKVVYAFGRNGAIFDHFEMVLPKGSSIIRENDSSISIITNRFRINYRPIFDGFNTNLPKRFVNLYMGKEFGSISTFDVGLSISIDFYAKSLLTAKGWEYYWWLDSFLSKLEQSFSKNCFLSKIAWYQNAAMVFMIENRRRQSQSTTNEGSNDPSKVDKDDS